MSIDDIKDPLFKIGIEAIASGDIDALQELLTKYPKLVHQQLDELNEGYFKNPYLLWFVADNPVRYGHLPPNIGVIAKYIIKASRYEKVTDLKNILNYGLGLVVSGRVPYESGVQKDLIDVFLDAGATSDHLMSALTHGRIEAAEILLKKGANMILPMAVATDRIKEIEKLLSNASKDDKQVALTVASFYGKAAAVKRLLDAGTDPNFISAGGFHQHATPLHQAVWSTSIETVKVLLDAGARTDIKDKIFGSTAIGWAKYGLSSDETEDTKKEKYATIEKMLAEHK